jgi:mono/diheme cytochrome c family protein
VRFRIAVLVLAGLPLAGCRERPANGATQATASPPPAVDTGVKLSPTNTLPYDTAGQPTTDARSITPAMVSTGRQIFVSACASCHGQQAEGTKSAPRLRQASWIDADGSYESISRVIVNGVPHPRAFPNPMLPYGGAHLTLTDVRAVAAYVYSLQRHG